MKEYICIYDEDDMMYILNPYVAQNTELIRCKDCKYCTQFEVFKVKWYVCTKHENHIDVNADDFCSYAERGKDEAD